jgi:hypothetical protein
MPTWPTWVLVIGVIVAVAAIAYLFCGPLVHRAPLHNEDVSHLDALDGVGRCDQRTCPGPAMLTVTDDEGHSRRVCGACFELGWRMGWWVSFADRQPYDQEAVAVFDAARKITREAAGGAA